MEALAAFRRCFSAHSRLACRERSAARTRAVLASISLSDRSLSRSVASLLSRSNMSLPRSFCCAESSDESVLRLLTLLATDCEVVLLTCEDAVAVRPRDGDELSVDDEGASEERLPLLPFTVAAALSSEALASRARLVIVSRGTVLGWLRLALIGRALNSRRFFSSSSCARSLASRASRFLRDMASPGSSNVGVGRTLVDLDR